MKKSRRESLRAAGWRVGSTREFLGLSRDEVALIELKLGLAALLREERLEQGLTQAVVAKRIGSSQSRVAKLEAGEASVSLDLMVRLALALGLTPATIGKTFGRAARGRGSKTKAG